MILHERPLGWGESGIMSDISFIIDVKEEKESTIKHIVGIIIGIANIVIGVITFTLLWRWFVASTFNLPEVNAVQAYGIMLLINFLRGGIPSEYTSATLERHLVRSSAILMPLFLGWIIHSFM